jgi:hypothetical protein
MTKTLWAALAAFSILPLAACDNDRSRNDVHKTSEEAGEAVDEAVDDTGRAAEEAVGSTDSDAKKKKRKAEHQVEDAFD